MVFFLFVLLLILIFVFFGGIGDPCGALAIFYRRNGERISPKHRTLIPPKKSLNANLMKKRSLRKSLNNYLPSVDNIVGNYFNPIYYLA